MNYRGPAVLARVDKHQVQIFLELDDTNTSFNDMITLPSGRSYLNLYRGGGIGRDELLLVEPDGSSRIVASELFHPNGMAVTPDGQTIIMCEIRNGHVTSFSIDDDGGLFDKKTFASDLQLPDGLCLDAASAVWIGSLFASEFLRVSDGGTITHRVRVPAPHWALAPMLGERTAAPFTSSPPTPTHRAPCNTTRTVTSTAYVSTCPAPDAPEDS